MLIQCRDLSLCYGQKIAFADLSLDIPEGQITALIGPSGCGKTSFLSCLNRMTDLLPSCLVEGELELGGLDLLDPKLDVLSLRRRVGMVFQKPNPFPFSLRRNLDLPLREHGAKDGDERRRRIEQALRDVGLWDEIDGRLEAPALALSGGQQQRLCIARALVLKPEVMLFDEPCSALDPLSSAVVEDHIASLRGRYTVVIVTHNLAQARRLADRVAFFWSDGGHGRLVEEGPCADLFERPRSEITAAYIEGRRG
jgi:phosphate transport system ATP-binding protein